MSNDPKSNPPTRTFHDLESAASAYIDDRLEETPQLPNYDQLQRIIGMAESIEHQGRVQPAPSKSHDKE